MNLTEPRPSHSSFQGSVSPASFLPPFVPTHFLDILFFMMSGICFMLGTVGNTVALKYFSSQRMDIPHRMYIWINVTDIVTSVLMLPTALSYVQSRAPILFGHVAVCQVWGVLWNITGRLSVFLVATLSITRSYQLARPFVIIKKWLVMGVVSGYAFLQLLVAVLPYFYRSIYIYDWVSVTCLWTIVQDIHPTLNRTGFLVLYVCCLIVPMVLPIFPTIASCLMSVRAIRRSNRYRSASIVSARRRKRRLGGQNDNATNTIILVTVIYIFCNIPFAIFLFFEVVD